MAFSNDNIVTRKLHGKLGNQVVFKTRSGESITSNYPKKVTTPPTPAQIAVRTRFKEASQWAKLFLSDPVQLALYKSLAKGFMSAFALAVQDFLRPPVVTTIDHSGYQGHVGDKISIVAVDEVKIVKLNLQIFDHAGVIVEQGPCQLSADNVTWEYTATEAVPVLAGTKLTATAMDNPLHTGELTVDLV